MRKLLDGATTPRVVLGFEPTLTALHEGRVHQLFLASDLRAGAAQCAACGRLTADLNGCPICAAPTRPVGDLRGQVTEQAVAQGARVEIVSGPAAALLMVHGGLGARTRY